MNYADIIAQRPLPRVKLQANLYLPLAAVGKVPFVSKGVHAGSKDGQNDDFIADLVAFFTDKLV